jgi:hypothetical protein
MYFDIRTPESDETMAAGGKYSMGFSHGVEQARPIVDLEHRVKWIENRVKCLSWVGAIATTAFVVSLLLKIKKRFHGKRKEKKGEEANEEGDEIRGSLKQVTTVRKFRRHARDFEINELS